MANEKRTNKGSDPAARRDFETGTVNPGPGMAPPHRANDIPAGSMTGAADAKGQTGRATGEKAAGEKKASGRDEA